MVPKKSKKNTPGILYLHGGNGTHCELVKTLSYVKRNPAEIKLTVIAPFGRGNASYNDIVRQDMAFLLEELIRPLNLDPTRLIVSGFSMGSWGTWRMIYQFPERFAKAVPIGGGYPWGHFGFNPTRGKPAGFAGQLTAYYSKEDRLVPSGFEIPLKKAFGKQIRFVNYGGGHRIPEDIIEIFNGLY